MPRPLLLLFGLASMTLIGCGSGATTAPEPDDPEPTPNVAPSLTIEEPSDPVLISRGGFARVQYTDDDPDDDALTWLAADGDGVHTTTSDRIGITALRPDGNGAAQNVLIDASAASVGETFSILGETSDGTNATVQAGATGGIEIANLGFVSQAGGTDGEQALDVATFPDGSCVVTGFFRGSTTFGTGEAAEVELVSVGDSDVFVARYNANGTLAWAKRAGGLTLDRGAGVAALVDGSCIVTGFYDDMATFGPGEAGEVTFGSAGGLDLFVMRLLADGSLAWAKRAGGTSTDEGVAVTPLSDNGCVVVGSFAGVATFGLGESNATTLTSAGGSDGFVARFASDGTLAWARPVGGLSTDQCADVAATQDDACVVTGLFSTSSTLGAGEPGQVDLTSLGGTDVFVARFNAAGTLSWAQRAGGSGTDEGIATAAMPDGSSVVAGAFSGMAGFAATTLTSDGGTDLFVARYNADGTVAWARRGGGASTDEASGIAALANGTLVATGFFSGVATLGPGDPAETMHTAAGGVDVFVAHYDGAGALIRSRQAGGTDGDAASAIAAHGDGSFALAGFFSDNATFDPGAPGTTDRISVGDTDIFVARLNADSGL